MDNNDFKIPYDPNKPFYKSKKVLAMVFGIAVAVGNALFGWGLDPNHLWSIIGPVVGYILAQAAVDAAH